MLIIFLERISFFVWNFGDFGVEGRGPNYFSYPPSREAYVLSIFSLSKFFNFEIMASLLALIIVFINLSLLYSETVRELEDGCKSALE